MEGAGQLGVGTISTHPPRAGRDFRRFAGWNTTTISTHPPRAGRDAEGGAAAQQIFINFNPPAPCGAGLQIRTKNLLRISALCIVSTSPRGSFRSQSKRSLPQLAFCVKLRQKKKCEPVREFMGASRSHAKRTGTLPPHTSLSRQSVRFSSGTGCRGSRSADCPPFRP